MEVRTGATVVLAIATRPATAATAVVRGLAPQVVGAVPTVTVLVTPVLVLPIRVTFGARALPSGLVHAVVVAPDPAAATDVGAKA